MAIEMVGGVYCPLSPRDPDQRLHALVQQTKCRVVIVHHLTKMKLSNDSMVIDTDLLINNVVVDGDSLFHQLIDSATTAESIAYIIFTSGSTGIPKPVSINEWENCELHSNNGQKCGSDQKHRGVTQSAEGYHETECEKRSHWVCEREVALQLTGLLDLRLLEFTFSIRWYIVAVKYAVSLQAQKFAVFSLVLLHENIKFSLPPNIPYIFDSVFRLNFDTETLRNLYFLWYKWTSSTKLKPLCK